MNDQRSFASMIQQTIGSTEQVSFRLYKLATKTCPSYDFIRFHRFGVNLGAENFSFFSFLEKRNADCPPFCFEVMAATPRTSASASGLVLPVPRDDVRDVEITHEGGLYISIKEKDAGRTRARPNDTGGPGENQAEEGEREREGTRSQTGKGESSTGVKRTEVHEHHGEVALLNDFDRVYVYGEAYGRCWIIRLSSDWQKENLKQRDQQLSEWFQALRAEIARPEDCAKASLGISLDGNRIYGVFSLHRAASYKSVRKLLEAAVGAGSDSTSSVKIELSHEGEKNVRDTASLIELSTQSTFSFGFDERLADRRKQKGDAFQNIEIQTSGLAQIAVLASDIQYKAAVMRWRPTGSRCLAVGCDRGVCLWHIKVNKNPRGKHLGYLDSATEMIFLQCHGQVRSMSWSPCGRLLVVSINKASAPLLLWDVSLGVNSRLSPGLNKGVSHFLKWSPCGDYLLTATESGSFFIWETHNWRFMHWVFKGYRLTEAVWSITSEDDKVILASFEGRNEVRKQQIRFAPSEDRNGIAPSLNIHILNKF